MEPRTVHRGSCTVCHQNVFTDPDGSIIEHISERGEPCPGTRATDVHEYGNAAAAAAMCPRPDTGEPIKSDTYQWYVAQGRPSRSRPPGHEWVDTTVSPPQRMYPLEDVRAWQATRPGRGNWDGEGARARYKVVGRGTCPDCGREINVLTGGVFVSHMDTQDVPCTRSGGVAAVYRAATEAC
jgi:hypothetical protein